MHIKQAVILAGGQGKRLRPFTLDNNKVMYPINGKPFLWHLIKLLKKNGIKEVLVLTGWQAEKVKVRFPGVKINYHYTPFKKWFREIQSTVRLKNALHLLDDYFLLMYCDNWWSLNSRRLKTLSFPQNVIYKNKDIGFWTLSKKKISWIPNKNIPIEKFYLPVCSHYKTSKRYYSISDPVRAEETARYLR